MDPNRLDPGGLPGAARLVGTVFGLIFLGVGLTVLGFLWGTPFNQFGSPPLFFRIIGSFIALAFVTMGGTGAYAAFKGKPHNLMARHPLLRRHLPGEAGPGEPPSRGGYNCDGCGAPLDSDAEVSPHGDVKCSHCDRWFNVHGR